MGRIEIKVFILIVAFFVLLSNLNSSYARYVSSSTGNTSADFSTWRILVSNTDVTHNYTATLSINPTILTKNYIRSGKFAPGAVGYFNINIDSSNIHSAFDIDMDFSVTGEIPNLKIIGISNNTSTTTPDISFLSNGTYIDEYTLSKTPPVSGNYENFYIRVFFKWIDNYNNVSTDSTDSLIAEKANNNQTVNCNINVELTFKETI